MKNKDNVFYDIICKKGKLSYVMEQGFKSKKDALEELLERRIILEHIGIIVKDIPNGIVAKDKKGRIVAEYKIVIATT